MKKIPNLSQIKYLAVPAVDLRIYVKESCNMLFQKQIHENGLHFKSKDATIEQCSIATLLISIHYIIIKHTNDLKTLMEQQIMCLA